MILILNILISIIGLGGIYFTRKIILSKNKLVIKFHIITLVSKLFLYISIIIFFIYLADKNYWKLLILSGMTNFIFFHFIEAFISQKYLLKLEKINV